jgi:hypothetical protein
MPNELFKKHADFKETSFTKRRFKHQDMQTIIEHLPFEKEVAGASFESRELYKVKIGSGKTTVLLWSQMHGDEATATMAIFDIFRFFQAKNDGFDELRKIITENLTLHFVPMLNPDGAERFQRRTSTGIDMNRDALALQTPEGRLLKALVDELKPEFSFNLHDKGTRYSAGVSGKQATVSFLATAYNQEKDWNETRTKSMQVICRMAEVLQPIIPGHLGRWSDDFEPRAFGDNVQKWGSSLVLIESGGYKDDREKQFIRQLNFVAILTALESIAKRDYIGYKLTTYEAIPNNDKYIFDLLIRNATFIENGKKLTKDIGVNLDERNNKAATDFTLRSEIDELGDLSIFFGLKEIDATDMTVFTFDQFPELMKKYGAKATKVNLGNPANLILIHKNKERYVIVNGRAVE